MENFLGDLYSADQIIGKSLIAKKEISVYNLPTVTYFGDADPHSKVIYTVKKGNLVGVVDTYLIRGGELYWSFLYQGKPYYVKHEPTAFDIGALQEQGTLNVKEQEEQKRKAGMTPTELFIENLKSLGGTFLKIAIPVGVVWAGYKLFSNYQKERIEKAKSTKTITNGKSS